MTTNGAEVGYHPLEGRLSGESHSPFLTDHESAQLTATALMGPLALVAFDTEPHQALRNVPEIREPQPKAPDTISEEFTQAELLTAMQRQRTVAAAAIMFADARLN